MANPLLREDKFSLPASPPEAWPDPDRAGWGAPGGPVVPPSDDPVSPWPPAPRPTAAPTLRRRGVASATGVLLAIICATGVVGWNAVTPAVYDRDDVLVRGAEAPLWVFGAALAALALALVTFFAPKIARYTAPLYAVGEGIFVGALSAFYEAAYDGIVLQAVGLTVCVFAVMLVLYATGRIRVTPRLRLGIVAATAGVALVYLVTLVLNLFGADVPYIHDNGAVGIGFSLLVVGIAAFNLLLDFDFVDRAEAAGAPRHTEWFAALGLTVTLVWLYLELLRLLAKLRSR